MREFNVREAYPPDEDGYFHVSVGYDPIIASFGDVIEQWVESDYSGSTAALIRDGDEWRLLVFGWGSCSGCDALEAATTFEEFEALREKIGSESRSGTAEEILKYVREHDWEGDWTGNINNFGDFRERAEAALVAAVAEPIK